MLVWKQTKNKFLSAEEKGKTLSEQSIETSKPGAELTDSGAPPMNEKRHQRSETRIVRSLF